MHGYAATALRTCVEMLRVHNETVVVDFHRLTEVDVHLGRGDVRLRLQTVIIDRKSVMEGEREKRVREVEKGRERRGRRKKVKGRW